MKVIKENLNKKKWEDYDTITCPDGRVIDMQLLIREQQKAKAALVHILPFFGGFIGMLRHVYTFRVDTQATDGRNIFINPQFTYDLDLTGKVFVMAHEIMHCVLNHMRRGKGHDPNKSNIAADYEVNQTLVDMGLVSENVIKGLNALIDSKYKGMGYESIYDIVSSKSDSSMDNSNQPNSNDKSGNSSSNNGNNGNNGNSQSQSGNSKSNNGQGQSGQSGDNQDSNEGGNGVVYSQDQKSPSGLKNVPGNAGGMISKKDGDEICENEGYDKDNASEASIEHDWQDASMKAAAKMKGDAHGNLKSKIEGIYKVTTDWKKALRSVVGHSLSPDEKRQAYANKNVLVSQDRVSHTEKDKYDNMDYMMVWIDSSGSMSDDQLKMCLSEVYYIALAKKPIKLVVIQCDTRIQEIKEYTNLKDLKRDILHATVKGRGGTELKPCWNLMSDRTSKYSRRPAELVMIFTDGYLNQYKRDIRHINNLCWVIIDNPSWNIEYKESRTKCIHIKSKDIK